jgi:hypothetical protein
MSQLLGFAVLAGVLAIIFFLPREEWPRAPTWMRLTAVGLALALAVAAVLLLRAGADIRDAPALMLWILAATVALSALRLLAWAAIGRVKPRSMLAAMLPDARPGPRARSR